MNAQALQNDMQSRLNASPYAAAAREIGFTFSPVEVLLDHRWFGGRLYARMMFCVCGTKKYASLLIDESDPDNIDFNNFNLDMAEMLFIWGVFLKWQLLKYGYSEELARNAVEKFNAALTVAGVDPCVTTHARYARRLPGAEEAA